jgi:hypothetical protein
VMKISLPFDQKDGSKDKLEVWSHTDRVEGPEETEKARTPTYSVGVPEEMVEVWLPSDREEDRNEAASAELKENLTPSDQDEVSINSDDLMIMSKKRKSKPLWPTYERV